MKRTVILLFALLSILAAAPAVAQEPAPLVPASAPPVTLSAEQFAQLVAKTTAGATTAQPAAPAPAAAISGEGVLGFSWTQIFGWLGGLVSMAFGAFAVFKTVTWLKARRIAEIAAEGAYHVAERLGVELGLEGAQRTALAIKAFYEAMTGHGITVITAGQIDAAQVKWKAMAAQFPSQPLPAPVPPGDLAKARADAAVANAGGSATDLADKAAS